MDPYKIDFKVLLLTKDGRARESLANRADILRDAIQNAVNNVLLGAGIASLVVQHCSTPVISELLPGEDTFP